MASDNIQLVRRFFDEVCNARRLDVADQLLASDHSYHRGVNDARWDVHAMLKSGDTVITAGPAAAPIPAICSASRRRTARAA